MSACKKETKLKIVQKLRLRNILFVNYDLLFYKGESKGFF